MSNQYPQQPQGGNLPPIPPQYGPYWQAPPPKKKHTGLKIAGGVAGGVLVLAVIGSLGSNDAGTPSATPVPTVTVTAAQSTTAPSSTAPAPKKTSEKPASKKWTIRSIERALDCTSADMSTEDLGLDKTTVDTLGLTDMDGCIGDAGEVFMIMQFKDSAHAQMVATLLPDQGFEAFQVKGAPFAVAALDAGDIKQAKRALS